MTFLEGTPHFAFLSIVALVLLVYLGCLGGVLAVQMALRGRRFYWVSTVGAVLFVCGVLFGHGNAGSGLTLSVLGGGLALAIFGAALDLILGPAS